MWIIGVIILVAIIVYFVNAREESKCPICKKPFARVETDRKLLSTESISKIEELERKDKNGKVIGTKQARRYGTRKNFQVTYKCPNCSYTWKGNTSEDVYQ